ncbi:MAG: hypothetical protein AAGA95_18890 [Pseudomonadota bacterium]
MDQDHPTTVLWRVGIAFLGGYALAAGLIALVGSVLARLGVSVQEGIVIGIFVGLVAFVSAGLSMIASKKPWRHGTLLLLSSALVLAAAIVI